MAADQACAAGRGGVVLVSHITRIVRSTIDRGLAALRDDSHTVVTYPAEVRVSDSDMAAINVTPHEFHGEWNHTIKPKPE